MHSEFARSLEMLESMNHAAASLAEMLDQDCDPVELMLDPEFTPAIAQALADGLGEASRRWAVAIAAFRRAERRLRSMHS
jgi:hypothetical protein